MKFLLFAVCCCIAWAEVFILKPPSFTLSLLDNRIRQSDSWQQDLYVFVTPPASLMYQHISLALELYKRQIGNILILTLKGYKEAFEAQLKTISRVTSQRKPSMIYIWEMGSMPSPNRTISNHKRPILLAEPTLNAFGMPKAPIDMKQADSYFKIFEFIANTFTAAMGHQEVQDLSGEQPIDNKNQEQAEFVVDYVFANASRKLMVVPSIIPHPILLAKSYQIPYVRTIPTAALADLWSANFIPAYHHSTEYRTSFKDRAIDLVRGLWVRMFLHNNLLSLDLSLAIEPALTLIFSHPFLGLPKPIAPSIIYTGAVVAPEREDPKHISKESLKLLNNNYPTVVLSFGTYAVFEEESFLKIFDAVMPDLQAAESWSLIWALPKRQMELLSPPVLARIKGVPGRISFEPWVVLPAILSHKNLKLFVSHCGGNSLGEALRAGVPVVGIPAGAEQPWNCDVASKNVDFIVCHQLWKSTTEDIRSSVERILFDPNSMSITENANKVKLLSERAYPGAPLAADWIQWAISRQKSTTAPLVTKADREGIVRALYLDVSAAIISLLFIVCVSLAYLAGLSKRNKTKLE